MANLSWDITGLSTDAWLFARRRLLRRSWARSLTRVPLARGKVTVSRYSLLCRGQTAGAAVVWKKQGNHVANLWVRSGEIERTAEETLSQIASFERILSLSLSCACKAFGDCEYQPWRPFVLAACNRELFIPARRSIEVDSVRGLSI